MTSEKEKIEKMLIEEEDSLLELYNARLAHLDKELEIKTSLAPNGFRKLEPTYEYENTPEYLAHMTETFKLTVAEEKVKILTAINSIERKRLQRIEQKKLMEEK